MFKQYNFENNVRDNCSLKAVTLMFLLLSFFLSHLLRKKFIIITHLFRRLIYEIQNKLHQLNSHISTLIMRHSRFSENEGVEVHISRYRDFKTEKAATSRFGD